MHFTLGTQLPAWQPGDVIVLLVTVNDDGSFTLVQGNTDRDPIEGRRQGRRRRLDDRADLRGRGRRRSAATTDGTITVTRDNATSLTCSVPST